ncbi:DNA-binding MarR family transcriptional regulator [Paenibacillus sp. W4I10]|uniref:MarR family transcriptional regulator n=1 Tax=Paenibacillus sp. W4I10 TaxID=3042298 RepID=UPI002780C47D|nr:MarR family transcriptional regulator [Paenibacillus sp. W4I10]MDQ0724230.1 DNA-binding MarR family transcriptional regulator [Paenibacillus sp. W4I10]
MIKPSNNHNKEHLINEVLEAVRDIQIKFQAEDDEEKEWLLKNSPNSEVQELVQEMTVTMLHVLDAIGTLEPVNGITISKQFGFSKGTVSKITKRLVQKNIILPEYLPDNKKEVLFRMTELGQGIYRLHQAMHQQIDLGANRFLQRYTEDELQFLVHALRDTAHTSWFHSEKDSPSMVTSEGGPYPDEASNDNDNENAEAVTINEEMNEIMGMLHTLNSRDLKKAKAVLEDVFFTEYKD